MSARDRLYDAQVEDVQDFVPIGAGDGPGNIGDGSDLQGQTPRNVQAPM